jgi:hypothetical protein
MPQSATQVPDTHVPPEMQAGEVVQQGRVGLPHITEPPPSPMPPVPPSVLGAEQTPPLQGCGLVQRTPQPPQLSGSLLVLAQ